MAWPIVKVTTGGIPVTESSTRLGVPYEVAANGKGTPVRFVVKGGIPVIQGATSETFYLLGNNGDRLLGNNGDRLVQ